MDLSTITDEILSQFLETQTRSELSSNFLEDESQEAADLHEPIEENQQQPTPTAQTRSELNSDLLEEELQQPTSDPPTTPIFPDEMKVYQQEDEASVSSFDFINKIEVNAIASIDNQESNSMNLGLPDSLLTAEDVWKESYYMVQTIRNTTESKQTGENNDENDPEGTSNKADGSESLEEVEVYPNQIDAALEGSEQQGQSQLDTNPPTNETEPTVSSQTRVLYANDKTETTNISGSIMASQPLLGLRGRVEGRYSRRRTRSKRARKSRGRIDYGLERIRANRRGKKERQPLGHGRSLGVFLREQTTSPNPN